MKNEYESRRAILKILARLYCPLDLKALLCFDEIIMVQDDNKVSEQWAVLTEKRYLIKVPGFEDYRSLSPKTMALFQADPSGAFMRDDPFLAGPFALR